MVDEKKMPKVSIGIPSLTVLFSVLCLTLLSVLALSASLTEKKFTEKRAAAQTAYYTAETECSRLVNQIGAYWEQKEPVALRAFLDRNGIAYQEGETGWQLSFCRKVDAQQSLAVELLLQETEFEILRWQVISQEDWIPDQTISVWSGEDTVGER